MHFLLKFLSSVLFSILIGTLKSRRPTVVSYGDQCHPTAAAAPQISGYHHQQSNFSRSAFRDTENGSNYSNRHSYGDSSRWYESSNRFAISLLTFPFTYLSTRLSALSLGNTQYGLKKVRSGHELIQWFTPSVTASSPSESVLFLNASLISHSSTGLVIFCRYQYAVVLCLLGWQPITEL